MQMDEHSDDPNSSPSTPGEPVHHSKLTSSFLTRPIENHLTSIPILLCCFTSGLIDANVFNAWGVFASMQTGNTVILALGSASRPVGHPNAWLQALMAVVFFFLGAFFNAQVFGELFRPALRRGVLATSFAIQTILIAVAAALVQGDVVPGLKTGLEHGYEDFITVIPIAMLAFQAGQQCVVARELGLNEIPTTVLTSVYCDLGNDRDLFAPFNQNWKRNRRFASAVLLLVGAIAGGWLSRTNIGMAAGLWFAAGIKLCITIAWLCWKAEKSDASGKGE